MPNATVFKSNLVNYTRNPQRRFDFRLGIDADDDPLEARKIGYEALARVPFVLAEPPPQALIDEVGESNIVMRFFGWIDQGEADWLRARSNAIAAVKTALEESGFALPEPIYRLRFDARTTPLPLENVAERPGAETSTPVPRRVHPAPAQQEDMAPKNEVAEMVERERRSAGGEQEQDLLDPSRPVE